MSLAAKQPLEMPVDGRQSETALQIARGTARLLHAHGFCVVSELPLPSGRRADLVALDSGGRDLDCRDQVVGRRFPRRPEMAGLPRPLRPAVFRDLRRGAVRDIPARHRADRGGRFRRRLSMRGARAPAGRADAQIDAAVDCARRRAAPAVAGRSGRSLWGRGLKRSLARHRPPTGPREARPDDKLRRAIQ